MISLWETGTSSSPLPSFPLSLTRMTCSGEETAKKYEITREQQDDHAIESYRRAAAAWTSGKFTAEIAPVTIVDARRGDTTISEDEEFKKVKADKVRGLKPVFRKDGTITAANASNLNDGASALILASQEKIAEHGLTPLARIICQSPPPPPLPLPLPLPLTACSIAFSDAACAPIDFPVAPAKAIPLALKKAGLEVKDIARFEINEAFSAVAKANEKILGLDPETLNTNGGAVAFVYPLPPSFFFSSVFAGERC